MKLKIFTGTPAEVEAALEAWARVEEATGARQVISVNMAAWSDASGDARVCYSVSYLIPKRTTPAGIVRPLGPAGF